MNKKLALDFLKDLGKDFMMFLWGVSMGLGILITRYNLLPEEIVDLEVAQAAFLLSLFSAFVVSLFLRKPKILSELEKKIQEKRSESQLPDRS